MERGGVMERTGDEEREGEEENISGWGELLAIWARVIEAKGLLMLI